jgi:hypothetical protein
MQFMPILSNLLAISTPALVAEWTVNTKYICAQFAAGAKEVDNLHVNHPATIGLSTAKREAAQTVHIFHGANGLPSSNISQDAITGYEVCMEDLNNKFEAAKPLWTRFLEVKQSLFPQLRAFCDRSSNTTLPAADAINEIRAGYDELVELNGEMTRAWYAADAIGAECRACARNLDRPCAYTSIHQLLNPGSWRAQMVKLGWGKIVAFWDRMTDAKQEL